MIRFGSYLQPNWDWRAAGNFMFGGTGSALMLMTALATWPNPPPPALGLSAVAFVGLGLFLVWLEIGRPWRFINVFFHPQASWMTREASVSVVLFPLALVGVLLREPILIAAAGVVGVVFLYCQARILKGSTGIPAWREPAAMPLIIGTGLTEGLALLIIILGIINTLPAGIEYALLGFVVFRIWAWLNYREALEVAGAPAGALKRFAEINGIFIGAGNVTPALFALIYLFTGYAWSLVAAAVLALAAGWHMKFVLVAKAAFVQGYGVGKLKRGRPTPRKPVRREGDPWQA